jgi:CheY-like chemotaxis protein
VRVYLPLYKLMSCRIGQMDVSMPFMSGMEATELIRAYETHNDLTPTPIIALTAHASAYRFHAEVLIGFVTCRATHFFSDW